MWMVLKECSQDQLSGLGCSLVCHIMLCSQKRWAIPVFLTLTQKGTIIYHLVYHGDVKAEASRCQPSAHLNQNILHPFSRSQLCVFCHLTFPDYHKQHLWMESQTNSSEGCDAPAQTGHWLIPRRQSLVTSTSLVSPPLCFSFRTTREMSDNALGCRALTYEMAVTP